MLGILLKQKLNSFMSFLIRISNTLISVICKILHYFKHKIYIILILNLILYV